MDGELYDLCLKGVNDRSLREEDRVVIRKILATIEELDRYQAVFGALPDADPFEVVHGVQHGG